jgi:predicted nucleic acid-binding protein
MALEPLFMDSGGFYALVSVESAAHGDAVAIMEESRRNKRRTVTTDYVLDETATLLRARRLTKQLKEFLRLTETSEALSIEWMTPGCFAAARAFMLKHLDQEFSFTDCVSFVVMKELRLRDALATDQHFRIAGFNPLLAE